MVLSILRMALPVPITFGLGYLCRRKKVFGAEGHETYISTALSVQTLASVAPFIGVAAWPPA
jgi:hypothetical protein